MTRCANTEALDAHHDRHEVGTEEGQPCLRYAEPDPAETVCQTCCEDHDYERNTDAGWATCIHCNAFAPCDYYDEQPGDY